ncbi:hypothetical protein ACFQGE_07015 [Halomicroarcula sp. GCM10025817]|uniref:hypothetical protein n=1 Tax=Haloarcula TaxID=2237 RepID=UPI0023E8ED2D|nr:hypothetical protein [Halomicroarcula sp. SYNS111]
MDPDAIFERAELLHRPGDPLPGGAEGMTWVAVDPETDCRGVGEFEKAARTNLVYAVQAYHDDPESTVPFLSAGKGQTHEMQWHGTERTSLAEHLQDRLPF